MSSLAVFSMILICYLIVVYLMYREIVPAIWGLPLMATAVLALVALTQPGAVRVKDLYTLFIEGPNRIGVTTMSFIFAGVFARSQIDSGIVENVVKRAAELGGDRPFVVAILLGLASAYVSLGTFVGGLFVAHAIAYPILVSLGLSPMAATLVQGFGGWQAISLWAQHWAYFGTFTKMTLKDMWPFLIRFQPVVTITWICFAIYVFRKNQLPVRWSASAESLTKVTQRVPAYAMLCPALPLVFILGLKIPDTLAFILSSVIALIATQPGSGRKLSDLPGLFSKIYLNGIYDMRYMIAINIGIGFILRVSEFPFTKKIFSESLTAILPSSAIGFILFFGVFMLVGGMFRGPAQPWAMGAAVYAAIVATQRYPLMVTGALVAVVNWFISNADPTTGATVYICALSRVSIIDYLKKVYVPAAIYGLIGLVMITIYFGMW